MYGCGHFFGTEVIMVITPQWIPESIRFGTDPDTGCEVEQLTSDAVTSTNIYCEQRYTSADGSRIALSRTPFGQPNQIWVCDLRTMRLAYASQGVVLGANAPKNALYFRTQRKTGEVLVRLDLTDFSMTDILSFDPKLHPRVGCVSPDEKTLLGGPFPEPGDNMWSIYKFDLQTGRGEKLAVVQDASNPHMQFDPAGSGLSLLQLNRIAGRRLEGVDPALLPGASLSIVDAHTGKVTPLPAGRPFTPPISGHECWAGTSGVVLYTAAQYDVTRTSYVTYGQPPECEKHMPLAAIYAAKPGDTKARVVADGKLWNHLAASDDGKYFIGDDHQTGRIHIGSIATGKYLALCDSHTRQGVCQYSHVHAYMTPDQQYVIFNSIVTGVAQVYAARIPAGFLAQLDS